MVSIDSYVLRVAVHANGIPFSCRARWGVRNAGDKAEDGFTFYLHPGLVLREIRDGAGTPLTHEASIKAYDLAYTGDIVAHAIEFPDPIKPGETRTLTAAYDGRFSPSDARGPSDYMRIDEQGVYLRGTGYSIWFPVQEAWDWNTAATFEVVLDVPSAWRPLAFGDLISEEVRGDRNVSHWSTGSPWPLLFCHLAATEWDVIEGTTLRVYHRRTEESRDAAIEYADVGERLLQFYHTNYGDRVETGHFFLAELCPFGGISAGNVIGLPTNRFADVIEPSRSAATWTVLAHELVHAFAIPAVVNDGPAAALLIEGFPSYYHALALQAVLGNETYVGFVRAAWKEYHDRREAAESSASDLPPEVPLLELAARDIPYYKDVFLLDDRFVVLLDRLRNMIGPEIFLRGTRIFLDRHRTAPARFADFISTLESVSGERLGEFADRWFGSTEALPEEWAPN